MHSHTRNRWFPDWHALALLLLPWIGCGNNQIGTGGGSGSDGSASTDLGVPDLVRSPDITFLGPYGDFPANPVGGGGLMGAQVDAVAKAFAMAQSNPNGGPCLSEPPLGALYPSNFNPPLFEWAAPQGQNMFELRVHVENQLHDLLVYSDQPTYTLDANIWTQLNRHHLDFDIQITVRSGQFQNGALTGAVSVGSSGAVHVAPAAAGGAIVYWTTSGGSALKGFRIGDTKVQNILTPASITAAGKNTACVGCHTSAPDGSLAFFGRSDPMFSVDARVVDGTAKAPEVARVSANALANLARTNQNLPTLSAAHFSAGDSIVITELNHPDTAQKWELVWTDLEAKMGGTGVIARMGDPAQAATPAWSHDGKTIAYVSSDAVVDGRLATGYADIWTVPYNGHAGGAAAPLALANETKYNQYYPTWSPDDTFVAFNRAQRGGNMYDAMDGEVYIISSKGGDAPVRLGANDPPACTNQKSPGVTNSWPRWAPSSTAFGKKRYYWLVFSSRRRPSGLPQLYLCGIVTISGGENGEQLFGTYPALYIPTQPPTEANHTPAWDEFQIGPF